MRAALLLGMVATFGCACASSALAQVREERGIRFDRAGAVRIYALAGHVAIHTWEHDSVHVVTTATAGTRIQAGGTRTSFKLNTYEGIPERVPVVRIVMHVPREAQLWVKTTSAPIEAHDLRGSVDLYTIEGGIQATGAPQELRIETMRGSVRVAGTPAWLRVRSGTGDVRFTGSAGDLDISSVSGDVTTSSARQRGRVETVRGAIRVASVPPAGATMEIDSHSGSVSVAAAAGAGAEFVVYTATGAIRNGLTARKPADVSGVGRELRFTLGRGGSRLTIRTFSGAIELNAAPRTTRPVP